MGVDATHVEILAAPRQAALEALGVQWIAGGTLCFCVFTILHVAHRVDPRWILAVPEFKAHPVPAVLTLGSKRQKASVVS